ncbi:hypothetical protein LWI28_015671 [Acer negundo]|uniref:CCHC-type domain-containing protein n=1 Tax=Acer negundo TaxID=4023 RepID=A0AAD5IAJ8_ACENE|nr:hypothetical protein LWI28_015671 [Acer negundo]
MAKSEHNQEAILREFVSRFIGSLRDWYQALGEYRQLQIVRAASTFAVMDIIFREFLGDPDQFYKQARQEFFEMRCCLLRKKDIDFHYTRMSSRYHILGGINNKSLKNVYVNSLPAELQDELHRRIDSSGRPFTHITLGEIHMFTLNALEKLYATQKVFSKMLKEGKRYEAQCKQPSYQIKCKSSEQCTCKTKKDKHFRSTKRKGKKKFKFFKKKSRCAWNKSQKCFICGQKGHYAKKCPNKKAKSAKLIQQLVDDVSSDVDIESIFSEQDHADDNTAFVPQSADFVSTISDSEYSSLSEADSLPVSYKATPISHQASHFGAQPGPQVSIQILPDKYVNPVDAIVYIDIGSITIMMNPKVLPLDEWKSHVRYFKAADGKIFTTNLITKAKIGLKIFPSYTLWTHVIRTPLLDKNILIGWDVYCQFKSLRILHTGIRYKRNFKAFFSIPKIFPLFDIQPCFQTIQQKLLQFYTNSHADFYHPNPL